MCPGSDAVSRAQQLAEGRLEVGAHSRTTGHRPQYRIRRGGFTVLATLLLCSIAAASEEAPQPRKEATATTADRAPVVLEPRASEGSKSGAEVDGGEPEVDGGEPDPTAKLPVKGKASDIDQETYQVLTGDVKPTGSSVPVWKQMLAPEEYKLYWNQGLRFERNDGYFRFKGGFRLEFDVASIHGDPGIAETIGGLGTFLEFRRAWLTASGTFGKRLIYAAQVDVTGNSTGDDNRNPYIRELFAGIVGLGPLGTVRLGMHKESFSFAELNSSKNLTFMERSLAATFAPGYDPGISSQLVLFDRRATLTYGAFYYTGAEGEAASRLDLTARVTALPIYADEGRKLLHLGTSYSHQFRQNFSLRYRRRPESHLAERFVDTGNFISDDIDLFSVETLVLRGPFSILLGRHRSLQRGDPRPARPLLHPGRVGHVPGPAPRGPHRDLLGRLCGGGLLRDG